MALKPEDLSGGLQHGKVVAFINEKMARHAKGPEFYLENTSLSWEEVEAKLNAILEDTEVSSEAKEACAWGSLATEVSSEAKEACAWGSLALGMRFAHRQNQLNECRVQCLHDFTRLQKSAAQALASDLKLLTAQREVERKEAASQLRLAQASLAEMRKERDLLRWKLFQTVRLS
ncbi:testis expressed 13B-like protein [Camelus ferus]|nr:testis expressed 13B-like protein [Camelus ferus]